MRVATAATAVILLVLAHAAAACNVTYCHGRGNGTGTDPACGCACDVPYYGPRCLSISPADWGKVQCDSAFNVQSIAFCLSSGACFWENNTCVPKVTKNNLVPPKGEAVLQGCSGGFPMVPQMFVFALATFCFGFCLFGAFYLVYWHGVYSRVDDTGVRMYNQFFGQRTMFFVAYFAVVVFFALLLAVTAWINFMWPDNCVYVAFGYLFLLILFGPLLFFAAFYGGRWVYDRCVEAQQPPLAVDDHVRPKKRQWRDENTCQSRLY